MIRCATPSPAAHDDDLALDMPALEDDVAGHGAQGDHGEELDVPVVAGDALDDRAADDLPLEPHAELAEAGPALGDDAHGLGADDALVGDELDVAEGAPSFIGYEHDGLDFGDHDGDDHDGRDEPTRHGPDDGGLEGFDEAGADDLSDLPALDGQHDDGDHELDVGITLEEPPAMPLA